MKIFLIAGEPSGDLLGSRLMQALKMQEPAVTFTGVGGPRMTGEGLSSLFPMSDLTLFGLAELFPKIPLILRRIRETAEAIRQQKPDIVVTIDAPDFCFRVAKKLVGSGIPFVHYVAPTVWAWRPGRARKIQPLFSHLLALFPFEPPYFERVGLPCSFVGHPLVEAGIEAASADRFRAKYGIPSDQKVLVVLPGSRGSELKALLPVFGDVVYRVKQAYPDMRVIIPVVAHLYERIRTETASWPIKPLLVTGDEDKYDAFAVARAALAASGTVALELGLAGTPSVIAYRIHAVTAALYRRLIKVKFANLVNIMADKMVVPEFIQENCTAEKIFSALDKLIMSDDVRNAQIGELCAVRPWLSPAGTIAPAQQAAQVVLQVARSRNPALPAG